MPEGMTLDEAIKILTPNSRVAETATYADFEEARWLGIKALEAYKRFREWGFAMASKPLEGETKE